MKGKSKSRRADVGYFLWTTTQSRMGLLDNATRILQKEMTLSDKADESLRASYAEFLKKWRWFYDNNKGSFKASLNATYETLGDFAKQFSRFRDVFLQAGGKTVSSGLDSSLESGSLGSWLPFALFGGAGAFIAWYLTKKSYSNGNRRG